MAEYIEREALCYQLEKQETIDGQPRAIRRARRIAENFPAADVRPVVRGKWIMNDECRTVCSLCGNVVAFVSHPDRRWDFGNYCPNCGANMRPTSMSGANGEES